MTLEEIVDQHYDVLNENDLYIWQYIYHHKKECQKMSIQELAHACNVSHTSIIRFAKKLELDGYSELKVYVKWMLDRTSSFDHNTLHRTAIDLKDTIDMMENHDFDEVCAMIDQAQRVFIYPTGEVQFNAAEEMKREFVYRRKILHVIEGQSELDNVLSRISKDDIFFIISLSGDNELGVTLAKVLQKMHIPSIGIAMDNGNLLSKNCTQFIGFKTNYFDTGCFDKHYCCTAQFFLIVNLLFMRYLDYCSLKQNA